MNPRLTIRRHGRALGMVGALVAVSATTTMALVAGTAAAAPPASRPGTCIDNVNVRAEPSTDAKIVAVCTAGKAVKVAESKSGFVHLTDLDGWAAQQYVSVNGAKPAPAEVTTRAPGAGMSGDQDAPATGPTVEPSDDPTAGDDGGDGGDGTDPDPDATDADSDSDSGTSTPTDRSTTQGPANRSPLSGLLG